MPVSRKNRPAAERATFQDLERFASKAGRRRPGRAVGGALRAFYIKHPGRVQVVHGEHINGSRPSGSKARDAE